MVHYTCDGCGRAIDERHELRHKVRVEVYAAVEDEGDDDERDHLQEIQDILERLDDAEENAIGDQVYYRRRYDLCDECRSRYVKNPLGWLAMQELNFSEN